MKLQSQSERFERIYFKGIFFNLKFAKNKYLEIFSEISPGLNSKELVFLNVHNSTKIYSKRSHLDLSPTNSSHLYSYIVITKNLNDDVCYFK